ncbi:TniB family NTP-binding protein [Actinacidiphila glaucinigra]|uniref:AAA family ATPase n=1 Tax=Actinacidiphila glaucinigra TaxID=235986 RepID=UPI00324820DE
MPKTDTQQPEALRRAVLAPRLLTPEMLVRLDGWNYFARTDLKPPDLRDCAPAGTKVDDTDPRVIYNGHLCVVTIPVIEQAILDAARVYGTNITRPQGLLGMALDGEDGTGKTFLLRAIGRDFQQRIEKQYSDRIPVVHILAPHNADTEQAWLWEIGQFLGLAPEPKSLAEALQWAQTKQPRYPDLKIPVMHVLEHAKTRMLLVDDIHRITVDQLAVFLPLSDYLRNKFGIATIYCGTGATEILHAARLKANRYAKDPQRNALPIRRLDPIPYKDGVDLETWPRLVKGFEKQLRLHRLTEGDLTRHATYLHQRTGGRLLYLSHLVCQAAQAAIHTGEETITLELLESINVGFTSRSRS